MGLVTRAATAVCLAAMVGCATDGNRSDRPASAADAGFNADRAMADARESGDDTLAWYAWNRSQSGEPGPLDDERDVDRARALARERFDLLPVERQARPAADRAARWAVARVLRERGRVDEALAIQRELQAWLEAAGERDGYVCEEMGECLAALGRPDEAGPWFGCACRELGPAPGRAALDLARLERVCRLAGGESVDDGR